MKLIVTTILICACSLPIRLYAQIGKRILDRTKNNTTYKINKKIDETVNKTIDKGINEIDTLLTGKKTKKTEKEPSKQPVESPIQTEQKQSTSTASIQTNDNTTIASLPTPNKYAQQMNTEWINDVIFTNIKCSKGKKAVEKKLGSLKGIKLASVNISNGELTIAYYSKDVSYDTIFNTINQLNFIADGKPAANNKDGCK